MNYYYDKVQSYGVFRNVIGRSNYNMLLKAKTKRRNSLAKEDIEKIFKITYKGHEFNAFPYLLNSFAAIGRFDYDNVILDLFEILDNCDGKRIYMSDKIRFDTMTDKGSLLDKRVLYSLHFTQKSLNILTLCFICLNLKGEMELLKYMFDFYLAMLLESISIGYTDMFYEYSNPTLCNTEVTGYYMGLQWILTLVPELRMYGGVNFKKLNISEQIEKNMPFNSFHARYVMGEITEDELYDRCGYHGKNSMKSVMCPLVEMEHWADMKQGICNEEPSEEIREVLDDWADDVYDEDNSLNTYRNMIGSYIYNMKFCNSLYAECQKKEMLVQRIGEEKEKSDNAARLAKRELKNVQNELKDVKEQLVQVEKERNELKENSTELLQKKIVNLTKQLKEYEKSEIEQSAKILEQKKLLSIQAKEIKNLTALVPEDVKEELVAVDDTKDDMTVEDAVEICKDKKILIVGGYGLSNFENKLTGYGIENVHMVVEARTLNGDYDVVVALTKVVKHKMTRLIDKFCDDTLFIPYNGTNVETLIIRIAKELNECNS